MNKFKWIEICPLDQLEVIERMFLSLMDIGPLEVDEKPIHEAVISRLKKMKGENQG